MSDQVTFSYYMGRLDLFNSNILSVILFMNIYIKLCVLLEKLFFINSNYILYIRPKNIYISLI